MAKVTATAIYQYGDPIFGRITLPKKTASEAIEIGDFVMHDAAGAITLMAAVTDDAVFMGISNTRSDDADGPQQIECLLQCVVEVPAVSSQYYFGVGLKTDHTNQELIDDAGANTIAWVWESDTGAAAESVKVLIDVLALGASKTLEQHA